MQLKSILTCSAILAVGLASQAGAATRTWIGGASADWSQVNNWVGKLKPGAGDLAVIPDVAGFDPILDESPTIAELQVDSGGYLRTSSFTITVTAADGVSISGELQVDASGSFVVSGSSGLLVSSGGLVDIQAGGTMTVSGAGQQDVDGTISVAGTATFSGSGMIDLDGGIDVTGTLVHSGSGTFDVDGDVSVLTGGNFTISGGGTLDISAVPAQVALETSTSVLLISTNNVLVQGGGMIQGLHDSAKIRITDGEELRLANDGTSIEGALQIEPVSGSAFLENDGVVHAYEPGPNGTALVLAAGLSLVDSGGLFEVTGSAAESTCEAVLSFRQAATSSVSAGFHLAGGTFDFQASVTTSGSFEYDKGKIDMTGTTFEWGTYAAGSSCSNPDSSAPYQVTSDTFCNNCPSS